MKRGIAWGCIGAVLLLILLLLNGLPDSQGIFYRVVGGQNDMVILGSIHAGSKEMYPMSRSIREALKNADVLVFECDTESPEAVAASQRLMYYPKGKTLKEHISAECYEQVSAAAGKVGIDVALMDRMKPWAVVSLLSLDAMAEVNGSGDAQQTAALGVETQVRKLAGEKKCIYLESAEEQLLLMDGFSPELQEYLLWDACESGAAEELGNWPGWWAAGDAEAFASSYRQEMAREKEPELANEYHATLITARNQHMATRLAELLESPHEETFFVTVGLMHLVLEEDSILTELKRMGYTIEKIIE